MEKKEKKEAAPMGDEAPPERKPAPAAVHSDQHSDMGDGAVPDSDDNSGDENPHADEDQDRQLIMDMLQKHGALNEAMDQGAMQMAKEMYEAYMEMGYKEDEAQKCAAHAMKLAKHMQGKQAPGGQAPMPQEAAAHVGDGGVEISGDDGAISTGKVGSSKVNDDGVEVHESKKQIIRLSAEIAKLKEANNKVMCERHLDRVLEASGLPREATKKFRESIKQPKSTEQIDADLQIFLKAYKEGQAGRVSDFFVSTEKMYESGAGSASGPNAFLAD